MAVNWTDEQRQVIETRGRNILVSAAAGSGKTAVLVERIMERILDKEDPVNIDELLIVTFTKAAAGEMRERITERIADAMRSGGVPSATICSAQSFDMPETEALSHADGIRPFARAASRLSEIVNGSAFSISGGASYGTFGRQTLAAVSEMPK